MKRLRVYLSSTFEDLKEYRAAVFAALEKGGLEVARMEAYTAADERPLDLCLRDVAQSEIYVGLFAWRYGYAPPADHGNPLAQSITELEYRQAGTARLRKLLFFAHPDTQAGWPDRFKDEVTGEGERGDKLNRFRREVGTEKTGSFFRTPDELATLVLASIMRSGLSGRMYNVPSRASGFVPRPKLTKSIVDALVGDGEGAPGASTLVQGPGGFGKTTLAIDVCHRAEVVDAFPDGLLWVTLGEQPDLAARLADLHVLATGNPPAVAGVEAIAQALAKALAGRRCLVVVDDAWRPQDLAPFLRLEGPRLLVTTRIRSLIEQAGQTGWQDVPVDEMEPVEGIAILARGLAPDAPNLQTLQRLADQLGCWPLLLELASARLLEENKARPGRLGECIERVTLLFQRKGVLGFDRRDPSARNAAVASSVDVGLERADDMFPGLALKAAELSVFPEDVAIPVQALADLWAMDAFDVEEEALRPLDDLSLLRWDRGAGDVRLHDMIRRAFEARLDDATAVHRRLVGAWKDAHHLPHDHAWRWFGWHCVRADESPRLQRLLHDVDWLRAKLQATEITAVIGDFDLVPCSPQAELLVGGLRLSAHLLSKDKAQLAAQLLARIPEGETELRDGLLKSALVERRPWLRPLRPSLTAPGGPLLRTLEGHSGHVTAVAMLPDGERAVSASDDWSLKVWNLQRGDVLRTLQGHWLGVAGVAITPDGAWAVSASWDRTLKVWDLESGVALRTLEGHDTAVLAVSVTPDGQRAVSASTDKTLKVWNLQSGALLHNLEGHADEVTAVVVLPDGRRAVSASKDKTLMVWDLDTGMPLGKLVDEDAAIALAVCPDGLRALSASANRTRFWHLDRFERLHAFEHSGRGLAIAPDGQHAVSEGPGYTLVVWDLEQGKERHTFDGHGSPITAVAFTPNGRLAVSASWDHTLKVWDLTRAAEARPREAHALGVRALVLTPDGQQVISVGFGGPSLLDLARGERLHALWSTSSSALAMAADGKRFVSASFSNAVEVWEDAGFDLTPEAVTPADDPAANPFSTPSTAPFADPSTDPFADLFADPFATPFSPVVDASDPFAGLAGLEATGATDAPAVPPPSAASFQAPPARYVNRHTLEGHTGWINDVAITADGLRAVSASQDKTLKVWDIEKGAEQHTLVGHAGTVTGVAITPDGARAVSASWDGTLKVWNLERGELLGTLEGHTEWVLAVVITPDGQRAVSASKDKTLKIWELASGTLLRTLEGHTHAVNAVALTADGESAVSGGDDRTVVVWDLTDGAVVATFVADSPITATTIAHDGRSVIAGDSAGRLHFLRLENAAGLHSPFAQPKE